MKPLVEASLGVQRLFVWCPMPTSRRGRTLSVDGVLTEKQVEHLGDQLMQTLGFEIVRFSMARATQQSPGIPDRLYINSTKKFAVWWEAKRAGGKQSYAQQDFEAMVNAVGTWQYVCGTDDALVAWCRQQGLCR